MVIVRRVTQGLLLVIAVSLISFNALASGLPPYTEKIAKNVYSFGDPTSGYNSMFVVTNEGVMVFESVNSRHAQALLDVIGQVTDQPVRYVFHSHNHWDHAAGGKVFQDVGAKTVAHYEAYLWMKHNPHPDMTLPDIYWKGSKKRFSLGGRKVELHYVGMSHGLGMTVFVLKKERIAYIADLVTPNRVLFTIVPDFNIGPFVKALKKIERMDFDNAVYSHSNATPFESKRWVTKTRRYVKDVQKAIAAEFAKGTPFGQIPDAVDLPKYSDWGMYEEWLPLNVWRIMIDGNIGPYPWRPPHDYEKNKP